MTTIALSLISHTNAGKTTLARTLLGRDVGEVRDAPNVTTEAAAYPLITTDEGDTLVLWDTPGFGDSARLARRLSHRGPQRFRSLPSEGDSRRSAATSHHRRSGVFGSRALE